MVSCSLQSTWCKENRADSASFAFVCRVEETKSTFL